MPGAKLAKVGELALQLGVVPIGVVARSLTMMEVGTPGVRVLLVKSFFAESDSSAFGVIGQEQQAIMLPEASNA
jgi:hypothetical protein